MQESYEKIVSNFLSGKIQGCDRYFKKYGYKLELAYCYLIQNKYDKAYNLFSEIKDEHTRARWGMFLVEVINSRINIIPKYFEIRNFLEIDINIFLTHEKFKLIDKIFRSIGYLYQFNPEVYKYVGRVLWANNYIDESMKFLEYGRTVCYNDPELHYLLAYIYYNNYKNKDKALVALNDCLEILPNYFPAENLKNILTCSK